MGHALGSFFFLTLAVVSAIVLAISGLLLVRKYVDAATLEAHHEVAGHFLAVIGTLYAVVLGFIVVDSINSFEQSRLDVEQEANALHNIYHYSYGLRDPMRLKIRHLCVDYCNAMIDHEWKSMENGNTSREASGVLRSLWHTVTSLQPANSKEENLQASLLSEMDELDDNRSDRIIGSTREYDGLIWGVLIIGGCVVVVFTYFFGVHRIRVQVIMTLMVTITLALNLLLIGLFRYPYSGDIKVPDTAFVRVRDIFILQLTQDE